MSDSSAAAKFLPFLAWRHQITADTFRVDLLAGLISALMVLPQAVAFSTLAGMPPEYGLYGAMLPAIVGALWGSSRHLVSGPTNATSLMVFVTLGALAAPFSPEYIQLALTLCLMIGLIKLALGLARLGALVNFISNTVVVAFTAGAAMLIIGAQLPHFFGIDLPQASRFAPAVTSFVNHLGSIAPWETLVGVVTLAAALAGRRWLPRIPYMLTGLVAGGVATAILQSRGVADVHTIGALPSALPFLSVPEFNLQTWQTLAPIALALTLIGLTEAISSARAVAIKTGQRIDGNQEFIGQGLANVVGAFSSCYPTSGSFNRTSANYEAGARTQVAAVSSAFFLVGIVFVVAPLAQYLPIAGMAAILFLVAWGLIDFHAIRRIAASGRGELLTLVVTFAATLSIRLEVAILVGVLTSLLVYLNRTTHPRIVRVIPSTEHGMRRFIDIVDRAPSCPQLDIVRIDGSLYFGAVDHIRDELELMRQRQQGTRHTLIVGTGINFIDASGAEMLAREVREANARGQVLYFCSLKPNVSKVLARSGLLEVIGTDRVFPTKADALASIYRHLNTPICAACTVRVFTECQSILPDGTMRDATVDRDKD